jgi:hypothetical protein
VIALCRSFGAWAKFLYGVLRINESTTPVLFKSTARFARGSTITNLQQTYPEALRAPDCDPPYTYCVWKNDVNVALKVLPATSKSWLGRSVSVY